MIAQTIQSKPIVLNKKHTPKAFNQPQDFIFELNDVHRDWILDAGEELEMKAGEVVIQEGAEIEAFYFLIEGLLKVHQLSEEGKNIAYIAPGQIIGEMSFVENRAASVSVSVVERAMLLKIPFEAIRQKMDLDAAFQANIQYALLKVLSARLRATSGKLNSVLKSDAILDKKENAVLWKAVNSVKTSLFKANEYDVKRQSKEFETNAPVVLDSIVQLYQAMNDTIGDFATGSPEEKEAIGYRVQQEVLPYFMMAEFLKRSYTKPRGYAGDYLTIAHVYDDVPKGVGRTGKLLDQIAMNSPSTLAVKNRRGLLAKEIFKTVRQNKGAVTNITTFASGPAQELFDVYEKLENPQILRADLVDIDLKALAFVSDKMEQSPFKMNVKLHNENLIYLALGRKEMQVSPQDLVYSIGLIDYFNDQLVVKLMDYAHSILKPGGRLILGNFHTKNVTKAFLDYILDWRLIHRDEADMDRLFQASKFAKPCSEIVFEAAGVNMFASCVK